MCRLSRASQRSIAECPIRAAISRSYEFFFDSVFRFSILFKEDLMNDRLERAAPHRDPEYPDIPYEIFRPAKGSPYYINPISGLESCLSPPGTPPMTSEDVRRELEDFP
jgi:hypothetical protein